MRKASFTKKRPQRTFVEHSLIIALDFVIRHISNVVQHYSPGTADAQSVHELPFAVVSKRQI